MNMGKSVLVVDDDQDLIRGLGVRLKANGYGVAFATDAVQAIAAARREKPDLILLDLGLPGGDGYLVMDRLKSMSGTSMTPVIVLSARDPLTNRDRSVKAGALAFLQKPVDNGALMATIRRALGDQGKPDASDPIGDPGDVGTLRNHEEKAK